MLDEAVRSLSDAVHDAGRACWQELGIIEPTVLQLAQFQATLYDAFDSVAHQATEAVTALHEKQREEAKSKMKQQALWHSMKIDTMRTAGQVALEQKAAEMAAEHNRRLEARMAALNAGSDDLLNEANIKVEELSQQLRLMERQNSTLEQNLDTSKKLAAGAQRQASKSNERAATLEAEAHEVREMLRTALASLNSANSDKQRLAAEKESIGEQVSELLRAIDELKEQQRQKEVNAQERVRATIC